MTEFSQDNMRLCYWNGSINPFIIGIVGVGLELKVLLDIINNDVFREFIPEMKLVAISDVHQKKDTLALHELGIPSYNTYVEMLEVHSEINLVIEMTGSVDMFSSLRKYLPESISLMDHREIVFFCGLHDMALVKGNYKNNLAHQQVLIQSIIDEIREDIFLMDKNGCVVDINSVVWRRAEIPKAELIGKTCWNAARLRDGSTFCDQFDPECPFHKTLKSGKKEESLVTKVNSDGLLQYYRLYAYPIFDMRGKMSHIMVMHRDITERTHREKHQNQRDKLAVIGEMSTYLAHEIRNPLFAIGGFANSLFKSSCLNEKDREKVQIIVEETKRLDRLLTNMLNFVRSSHTSRKELDIVSVVQGAAELMSIGYGQQGYRIEVCSVSPLPNVLGDEDALKQCIVNLIKNAVEAMPEGGDITLSLDLHDGDVVLQVTDTGVGMNDHEQDRVFNPFYSTKEDGSGLGLAMIKKIVEELGGRVELASKPGHGTTVSLFLPPALDVEVTEVNDAG
ncbi:Signal transduction histidine kinase [Maridesulfovibrio ferrireducens]|uniref:histidine kinase n=1 Tax=Maridesulfovibrio ferrireducens TaxID=246191 RepID=A0A1G9L7S4_9BACT|nr:ATP-binding protein [Maridesulfovibrio ferrireducens]SDL57856.1 Signal transduction histidine kinase [Maridesulfovibrio ferrireducens]